MKTYKHLFEQSIDTYTILSSTLDAAENKLHRGEVMNALIFFDRTHDFVIDCANNPDYKPCEDNTHEIIDGANHKKRHIEKPMFCPEQILHHIDCRAIRSSVTEWFVRASIRMSPTHYKGSTKRQNKRAQIRPVGCYKTPYQVGSDRKENILCGT